MRFANGTLIFDIPGFEDSEDRCILDAAGLRVCWVDVAAKRVVCLQKVPVSDALALLPVEVYQAAADAEEPICFLDFIGVGRTGKQAWLRVDAPAVQAHFKPGARSTPVPRAALRKLTPEECILTGAVEVRVGEAQDPQRASEVERSYRNLHNTLAGRLEHGGYRSQGEDGQTVPLRVLYLPPKGVSEVAIENEMERLGGDLRGALGDTELPLEIVSGLEDFKRRFGEKPRNLRAAYQEWPRATFMPSKLGRYRLLVISVTREGCLGSGVAAVASLWLKQGGAVAAWSPEGRGHVRLVNGLALTSPEGVRPEVWKVKIYKPEGQGA